MDNYNWIIILSILLVLVGFTGWVNYHCLKNNKTNWRNGWLNRLDGLNRLFAEKYHRLGTAAIDVPQQGGAIIISNHVSGLDPLLLIAAARRPLRFMIAREEYERFGLTWLFKAAGCIAVERKGRPDTALREAIRALNEGEVIVLFPYGGIYEDESKLPKFKRGAIFLATKTNSIIYPVRLDGIAGRGYTILAVPMRSRAKLQQFNSVNCNNMDDNESVEILDNQYRNHRS